MATRDFRRGAELAWENGKALLDEAGGLLRRGGFGYSLGLALLGIEELAKAELYILWSEGVKEYPGYEAFTTKKEVKLRAIPKAIYRHEAKFDFFINFLSLSEAVSRVLGISEAIERGLFATTGNLSAEVRWFVRSRQKSFYVDFEDRDWYTPLAVERTYPEFLLSYARKYMLWVARLKHEGWFTKRETIEKRLRDALSQGEPRDNLRS